MSFIKNVARKIVFPGIIFSGLEKLISTFSQKGRLVIMYHGVVPHPQPHISVNHLALADFEQQIRYISRHFCVVPLIEMFNLKDKRNEPGKKKIAVTFDDGYRNNFIHAFPVLKKYQCPATIFMVTKALEKSDFILWYDVIDILKSNISLNELKKTGLNLPADLKSRLNELNSFGELKDFFKKLNTEEKYTILDPLTAKYKDILEEANTDFKTLLKAGEMKEMIASGLIEIGSHTHSHPNLAELKADEIKKELSLSKMLLESATGEMINSIAFPDGNYTDAIKQYALEAGYTNLLAVDYQAASDPGDKKILPRFCISNTTTSESNIIQIHLSFSKKGF